jgi:hypothetical protein
MSTTIIWCDWGDNDTKLLSILWEGIPDAKVLHITKWNHWVERSVEWAIAEEKDTLLFCGHGSVYGLLAPKSWSEYVIHEMNVGSIQAKNVIGIMCWGAEVAERVGLHGLFSSMFVSNMDECVNLCIESTQSEIDSTNKKIFEVLSEVVKGDLTMEDGVMFLKGYSMLNGIASFNIAGIQVM